jgi:tetratricopeptide (TPR) repeat protein
MRRPLLIVGILLLAGAGIWWRSRTAAGPPAPPSAEQRLREAIAREPGSAGHRRALGQYYLHERQPFRAIWELEQALALGAEGPETRVEIATALALAELYPAAEAELRTVIAATAPSQTGRRELASLLLWTAQPAAALAVLREAPGRSDWADGQLLLGRTYEALGRIADARHAYERFAKLAPQSSEGPFRLARLLLIHREPRAARAVLAGALRAQPAEPRLLQLMAMTYSARWGDMEDPERQSELLNQAISASGARGVAARLALAELHLSHHRYQEGGRLLAPIAEQDDLPAAHRGMAAALAGLGERTEAQYHLGMAAVVEGHADQALPAFRALEGGAPGDVRAPQLLSQTYAQMNRLHEALAAARSLYDRGDRSPELFARLATLTLLTHDRRAARRIGEEWRRAQPESGRPLAHLGKVALADLRLDEAVKLYEDAVAREPKNPEFRVGLADALTHRPSPENSRRALSLLREAVVLAEAPGPRYQLGLQLQQMGEMEAAQEELLRALDGDPNQVAPYNNLLQVATALRQPSLAKRFETLLRVVQERKRTRDAAWRRRWEHPGDAAAYYELARDLARTGGLASAEHQLKRALELRPRWAEAAQFLGQVQRLLDGIDPDGRRLVRFPEARVAWSLRSATHSLRSRVPGRLLAPGSQQGRRQLSRVSAADRPLLGAGSREPGAALPEGGPE